MHYNGAAMPTRVELEAFGILIAGGAALAFIVAVLGKRPQGGKFSLNGLICDRQQVLEWLDRKVAEGKITTEDVQQLLLTDIAFKDWLQQRLFQRGFDIFDLNELRPPICSPAQ